MSRNIIIAVDGLASSGKSTLAKQLASVLNYDYIDSGAFYRAVTYYLLQHRVDWNNESELKQALSQISVSFGGNKEHPITFLNGENVEMEIRSMQVSGAVSEVSMNPAVRNFISDQLRESGKKKCIVMDGRDIGTVVFPEAELKIYLTADKNIRSGRRFSEMKERGVEVTKDQITQNLSARDLLDSTRITAPLKKADDAFVLDNTQLTLEQQFDLILKLAKEKIQFEV
jgi:cytidylate kinase